jgi:hypothetical protein
MVARRKRIDFSAISGSFHLEVEVVEGQGRNFVLDTGSVFWCSTLG